MDEYETGTVDFVPNRLLMFDGRLPHGAEATQESDDDKKEENGDESSNEFTDVDFDDI